MDMGELEATRRLLASDHTARVAGAGYIAWLLIHCLLEKTRGPVVGVTNRSQIPWGCFALLVLGFAPWQ